MTVSSSRHSIAANTPSATAPQPCTRRGCTNHCKSCFQPQTWDFCYGQPFTEESEQEILKLLAPSYISGLTLLGGEPFEPENQRALLPFVRQYARIDEGQWTAQPWPHLQGWLQRWLDSALFAEIMQRHPAWAPGMACVTLAGSRDARAGAHSAAPAPRTP